MKSNWRTVSLGDICNIKNGYAFKSKDFSTCGIPVIKIKNVKPNQIVANDFSYIPETMADEKSKWLINKGEILLTMTGNRADGSPESWVGKAARFTLDGKYLLNQRVAAIKSNCEELDTEYLGYYLSSWKSQLYFIKHSNSSGGQANISPNIVKEYSILLPPIGEQKQIVSILSSLEDKIELNNKINENLAKQVQAIYKSWFVNLDPFGGIKPDSWETADIYSLADIIYGAPFASKKFNTEGIGKPIIRIRDLKEQQFATYTTEQHPKGYLLQPGDIVVGMDGEFRPYIWGNDEAWLNQRICVFKNKRPYGKAFLYCTLKPLLHAVEQTQVATTVIHIGKKDFDAFRITLPNSKTLDRFDALTTPMIEQIVSNRLENKGLASVRDVLLPKLMSGEIDVSNIPV